MNNSDLKVSVVISTFNRCEKLQRAILSVLDQTVKEIEVIVVDNASTDKTREIVDSFHDSRVKYIRHDKNLGGPAARNTGIRAAKADVIALLDDDDQWFPLKLERQIHCLKQAASSVGLVYTGSEIYDERLGKVITINQPVYRGNVYKRLLLNTILGSVSSVLVRKECFAKVGLFDEELKSCQDWDMWLRIAKEYEFDFTDEILTRINMHGVQISTNYAALIPGRTRMVEKHAQEFSLYPEIYVVHLKRLGKLHCINGTWSMALSWFKKAVSVRKLEIFKIMAWCCLELPWIKYFSQARKFERYKESP